MRWKQLGLYFVRLNSVSRVYYIAFTFKALNSSIRFLKLVLFIYKLDEKVLTLTWLKKN